MPLWIGHRTGLSLGSGEAGRAGYQNKTHLLPARTGTCVSLRSEITPPPAASSTSPQVIEAETSTNSL